MQDFERLLCEGIAFKQARSEEGSLRDEIPQAGFRAAALTFPHGMDKRKTRPKPRLS